jgi:hypothetical protein
MIEDDAVTQNSHEHDTAPERMFTMIFLFEEPCPLPDRKLLKRLIKITCRRKDGMSGL